MWHKPCRTFNPWCLCIKTRCLYCPFIGAILRRCTPYQAWLTVCICISVLGWNSVFIASESGLPNLCVNITKIMPCYVLWISSFMACSVYQFLDVSPHLIGNDFYPRPPSASTGIVVVQCARLSVRPYVPPSPVCLSVPDDVTALTL